jgi:hypothetical protein
MLKLGTLRWKGRCKRHPRYDPAEGEGAIKGACQQCQRLLEIHLQHRRLVDMMRAFGPVRDRTKRNAAEDSRQASLFDVIGSSDTQKQRPER